MHEKSMGQIVGKEGKNRKDRKFRSAEGTKPPMKDAGEFSDNSGWEDADKASDNGLDQDLAGIHEGLAAASAQIDKEKKADKFSPAAIKAKKVAVEARIADEERVREEKEWEERIVVAKEKIKNAGEDSSVGANVDKPVTKARMAEIDVQLKAEDQVRQNNADKDWENLQWTAEMNAANLRVAEEEKKAETKGWLAKLREKLGLSKGG